MERYEDFAVYANNFIKNIHFQLKNLIYSKRRHRRLWRPRHNLSCWTVQFRLQPKRLRTIIQHCRSVGDEYYCMAIVVQQTLEQSAFGVGIEG